MRDILITKPRPFLGRKVLGTKDVLRAESDPEYLGNSQTLIGTGWEEDEAKGDREGVGRAVTVPLSLFSLGPVNQVIRSCTLGACPFW